MRLFLVHKSCGSEQVLLFLGISWDHYVSNTKGILVLGSLGSNPARYLSRIIKMFSIKSSEGSIHAISYLHRNLHCVQFILRLQITLH
jgi:hypothetical protein